MEERLKEAGVIILFLTIQSFLSAYYLELGLCKYYNIPAQFISITLQNYGGVMFGVIAFFAFLTFIVDAAIGIISAVVETFAKWMTFKIVKGLVGLVFVFCFLLYLWWVLNHSEMTGIGITFLFGFALTTNTERPNNDYSSLNPKLSITVQLSRTIGRIAGPSIMISCIICGITFWYGYYSAEMTTSFLRKDNMTLLRKYNDIYIYRELDSNLNFVHNRLIIVNSNNNTFDTFLIYTKNLLPK